MILTRKLLQITLISASLLSASIEANAQIKIGQTLDLSGVTAPFSRDFVLGMRLHFDSVNNAGGIRGKKIELVTLDDEFNPDKTLENTKKLIVDPGVVGLAGYRGTNNIQKIMPMLTDSKIALVGTPAGAKALRTPVNPYLFHNRASLAQEVAALVNHAVMVGSIRIGIAYQDDGFGKDGLVAFDEALVRHKIKPVVSAAIPRNSVDVSAAAGVIAKINPEVIIFVGQSKPAAALYLALKEKGGTSGFMGTSVISGIYNEIGAKAHGIIVSQVTPSPFVRNVSQLVDEYRHQMFQTHNTSNFSHTSLEGYLIARMVTQAINNSGGAPSREKFATALEAMRDANFGGYKIRYTESDHGGSNFVEVNMIRSNGTFAR